ncbi:MAG: HAD-IA family hydrolase [Cyanobacteria bacterium CRU_2_1]|nr:HAD-IA family hydrolase [Cyanobacteria bacterium RU_5_0]NJR60166.1 HAD-IA family hydrolase [Cyanobacteria bacterium CRU_2_1]
MLAALLFDLDGTLVETDSIHFLIWQDMLQEQGLEIDRAFYQTKISGRLNPDIVRDLLPQLSPEKQAQFIWDKEAEFRNRAGALIPMPGLADILAWSDEQALKRAVVSNAPKENAQFMLQALKLAETFPMIVLGDDLPKGKPDPMPYQTALDRLGVTVEETIAFEDSPSGICSAVGAGILTIGIASTHTPEDLYKLGTTLVVKDFTDPKLWDLLHQSFADDSSLIPSV